MTKQLKRNVFFASLTLAAGVANVVTCAQPSPAATLRTVSIFPTAPGDTSNVKCPGSVSVTALAVGKPGDAVSYTVFSFFNGRTTTVVPPTSFNLTASDGVDNRTLTVAVPSLTGGDNYIELDVTPREGSTQTSRTPVSCAPPPSNLAIATGLASAVNAGDCDTHLMVDAQIASCTAAVSSKKLVLTWNYNQSACTVKPCGAPDGFNILRSDKGGSYAKTAVQNQEPDQTAIVLEEQRTDAYGSCFKVQPYRGSDIGDASAPLCIVPDPVAIDGFNFMDAHSNYVAVSGPLIAQCPASGGNPMGQNLWTSQGPDHQIDVGYIMQDNSCSRTDSLHQGYVQFDVTHLYPVTIRSAVFQMHVTAAAENDGTTDTHSNGHEFSSGRSCAASIGTPSGWTLSDGFETYIAFNKVAPLPSPGSDGVIRVDVTDLVRKWYAAGDSKAVVVVSPGPASISAVVGNRTVTDRECLTSYDGVGLNITYGV